MSESPASQDQDPAEPWRQLRASLEGESGGEEALSWRRMVLALMAELEGSGSDGMFRVERVGERLVFSVAEGRQIGEEPHLALTFLPEDQSVKVAYGRGDAEGKAPLIEAWVSAAVAGQVTAGGLRRLWTEGRPGVPMPEELLRA